MAIRRLIAAGSYEPEKIRAMTDAYDIVLIVLRLNDKDDPITELLAKSIAAVVATGECKPGEIASKAIDALGIKRPQSLGIRTTVVMQGMEGSPSVAGN